MILIAILVGIILGQYIRLDVNPKALDFARTVWAFLTTEAPAIIGQTHDRFFVNKLTHTFPAVEGAIAAKPTVKTGQSIVTTTAKDSDKTTAQVK